MVYMNVHLDGTQWGHRTCNGKDLMMPWDIKVVLFSWINLKVENKKLQKPQYIVTEQINNKDLR